MKAAPFHRLREQRGKVEGFHLERLEEPLLDGRFFALIRHRGELGIADAEDIEHEAVGAGENVGAQNIKRRKSRMCSTISGTV